MDNFASWSALKTHSPNAVSAHRRRRESPWAKRYFSSEEMLNFESFPPKMTQTSTFPRRKNSLLPPVNHTDSRHLDGLLELGIPSN